MPRAEQTFAGYLYRPYLDLGPAVEGGPLHPWGVEFACRSLLEGRAYPWVYAEYPPSFRAGLLRMTGLPRYRVGDPRELAPALRTPRWQRLCDELDRYDAAPPVVQGRVVRLLGKLGLYRAVLDRVAAPGAQELRSSAPAAELAYLRALARFLISEDGGGAFDLAEFARLAAHAPRGSLVRVLALNHLAVQHAKRGEDAAAVAHWLRLHHAEIQRARPGLDEAAYATQMSRHHRAAGFLPMLRGDQAGVVREMEQCQQYAERLPRDTLEQRVAADELLHAALESRTKEALWLGDLGLAEARARRLVALCPLDPAGRDHLGQVLLEQGRLEEALDAYLGAARIGAPEAEAAWFMAGQCYEALGAPERACDAYLTALRYDPLGLSAAERLAEVAARTGNPVLADWSRGRLADLQARAATQDPRRGLSPYQEYAGQLGAVPDR